MLAPTVTHRGFISVITDEEVWHHAHKVIQEVGHCNDREAYDFLDSYEDGEYFAKLVLKKNETCQDLRQAVEEAAHALNNDVYPDDECDLLQFPHGTTGLQHSLSRYLHENKFW